MPDQDNEPNLTRRVAIGAAWLVAGRWIIRLIGLISILLLARLLTPADFGIVALASLVVAVLDALTEFRFGQALVHYQDATIDEYNTAWTFNVMRGMVVATVLASGAWLFAWIFEEPRLVHVLQALALVAILEGLQNIGTIQFIKDIRFDRDFTTEASAETRHFRHYGRARLFVAQLLGLDRRDDRRQCGKTCHELCDAPLSAPFLRLRLAPPVCIFCLAHGRPGHHTSQSAS